MLTEKQVYDMAHHFDGTRPDFEQNIHQNYSEVVEVLNHLDGRKFDHFVEVGVAHGGSLWLYSQFLCNQNALIEAIDTREFPLAIWIKNKIQETGFQVITLKENSMTAHQYIDNTVDLLHIDAQHDPTVFRDWELYMPKVKSGGIILLHDTALHQSCIELAEQVSKQYETKTFKSIDAHGNVNVGVICGITVVHIP
jgi:hypothetical protein